MKTGYLFAVALLLLRVCVGFHFFKEGTGKLADPKPFSAMFFGAAKGPMAEHYHNLVWDADGLARFDAEQTVAAWAQYVSAAKTHYGFSAEQTQEAEEKLARREEMLRDYLAGLGDSLDEYKRALDRRAANRADAARSQVPSLRGQSEKVESEIKGKRGAWLGELDKLAKDLERDMEAIASPEQRAARGKLAVYKPGRKFLDSESMDKFIPYFDLTLGVLLIVGLFTRPAALAAAGFLISVVIAQWPGAYGTQPTYYQAVEACSLLLLAAANAGRCGGLDSVIDLLWNCCCGGKSCKK